MKYRRWTTDEDAIIVATIRLSAVDAAARLNRTVASVEKRRSRLFISGKLTRVDGVKRPDSVTWTADEDAIIIATRDRPIREVAAQIPNHTAMAVGLRRTTLKRRGHG